MFDRMADAGVSIIVPCHFATLGVAQVNGLRHALDAIRNQRFSQTYEIILVDDGSPVPLQSLSPLLGASRRGFTRLLRHGRHLGSSHAFNTGLAQARYAWIAPFDLDNPWGKDTLETLSTRTRADPDLSLSAHRRSSAKTERTEAGLRDRLAEWSMDLHWFASVARPFLTGSVLARTDVFRLLGGFSHDPRSSHRDEYSLWCTWFRFFKPAFVDDDQSLAPCTEVQSAIVHRRFGDLGTQKRVPSSLGALAGLLGCTGIEAGKLAYVMWRFRPCVRLPEAALLPLQNLMPDRQVLGRNSEAGVAPEEIVPGLSLSFVTQEMVPIQAVL